MSNGYNDYKQEMQGYVHFFEKDGKLYNGIQFTDECSVVDGMSYQYCDLMSEDVKVHHQIQGIMGNKVTQKMADKIVKAVFGKTTVEMDKEMQVAIIQVGSEDWNHYSQNYDRDHKYTLYLFHNDWLMCGERQNLFAVDEHHMDGYKEISEKEYVLSEKTKREFK